MPLVLALTEAAAPTPAPAPDAPAPEFLPPLYGPDVSPPAPGRRRRSHFILKAAVNGYFQPVFAVNTYGGGGSLRGGLSWGSNALSWDTGLEAVGGRTEYGLDFYGVGAGFTLEHSFLDRLRAGIGARGMVLTVERATSDPGYLQRTNEPMHLVSVGLLAHVAVDLARPRENDGVFLQASLHASEGGLGPMLSIGYRFEAARETRNADRPRWGP